ncbi:MAG: sensor domain-containing diguanylate cyclase, partial [Candidatus Eremiobacteraeota bacterium]|nr:sensor domain-containing diguanylate cyclase [Candidatus Eremiobacteraeota bacterium]
EPHIRFYAGAPIIVGDANAVGTLCVIDRVPRTLSDRQREELGLLAQALRGLIETRVSHRQLHRYEAGHVLTLHDISEEQKRTAKLSYEASHDGLTGLYNRRQFERCLAAAIDTAKGDARVHTLTYLDLDHFKPINDRYGHAAGDFYLAELARQLRKTLRGNDVLGRIGGDEFGFIMHDCTYENARPVLAALEKTIELLKVAWQDEALSVGVSYGTVEIDERTPNVQDALHVADSRCYESKQSRLSAI